MKNLTVTRNAIRKAIKEIIKNIEDGQRYPELQFDKVTTLYVAVEEFDYGFAELSLKDVALIRNDKQLNNISDYIGDRICKALDSINKESNYKAQEELYQREFTLNNY